MSSPAVTTRVYMARHCDVHNPRQVLYGHLPDFPLSDKGVAQAHELGAYFSDKKVPLIYTSPLERALQTATIIASHCGNPRIVATDELIEAKFGLYLQGLTYAQVPWRRPLWFVHRARRGLLRNDESLAAMAARTRGPILRLVRDFPGEGGICVSHGDPIQAFWSQSQGQKSFRRLECAKGGLLELDYEDERLAAVSYRPPVA